MNKFRFPVSRYIVFENSMSPMFKELDRVLTFNWGNLQKGSVVIARVDNIVMLKRVKSIGRKIVLHSDNKKLAKKEYEVLPEDIIGRVFLKY